MGGGVDPGGGGRDGAKNFAEFSKKKKIQKLYVIKKKLDRIVF